MDSASYARRQSQIRTNTLKEIARIDTELYGRHGPHPALKQVVPNKYYNRGDYSYIHCIKCGMRTQGERRCPECEAQFDASYIAETQKGHNKYDYPENWYHFNGTAC
jgi:hypothetical protein